MAAPDFAKNGVAFQRGQDGRIGMVTWGKVQIPLQRPVVDCEVALATGGTSLVILAGGVRESLDLYLVPKEGGFQRHATTGRRLPARFNGGSGPWPVVEGSHLVLFTYEKDGGLEFRALDFAGRVLAQKRLSPKVESFAAGYRKSHGAVVIEFDQAQEPLTFRHPLAPRLQVAVGGLVQFGKVDVGRSARQTVELRNTGKRTLSLQCGALGEGFHLVSTPPRQLVAGGVARLVVEFRPEAGKDVEWTWKLEATGVVTEHLLVLRGSGVAPIVPARPAAPSNTRSEVPPPELPAAVASPRVLRYACYPRRAGAAAIEGSLALPAAPELEIRVGAREVVVPVDREGRFFADVEAAPGTELMIRAVSGDLRSPFVPLGEVAPMLALERGALEIRCRPEEAFRLTAYADGVVLRSWRGVCDASGRRRLPRGILGPPQRGVQVVLRVSVVDAGQTLHSAPLTVR